MSKNTLTPAELAVEALLWPDGPRCPRCPDSRRFVRDKSRDGSWHRCLSCYVCASATAGTFLHGLRTPLPVAVEAFKLIEARPDITAAEISRTLATTYTVARNLQRLWKEHRLTDTARKLMGATTLGESPARVVPAPAARKVVAAEPSALLHPSHPLHGLL